MAEGENNPNGVMPGQLREDQNSAESAGESVAQSQPDAAPPDSEQVSEDAPSADSSQDLGDSNTEQTEEPQFEAPSDDPKATRSPFWKNITDKRVRNRKIPTEPTKQLDREGNYSKFEDINSLVDKIRSGTWETSDRERILRERYGDSSLLRQAKAWLSGEQDVTYNQETGEVRFNYGTEIARRAANLGLNIAQTGGLMAAFGILTGGGATVALGPALIGSSVGRALVEVGYGVSGAERNRREKLIVSRERYYKKAFELANRVPIETPSNWDDLNPEERATYVSERNEAIKNVVNFVYSSEQNSVTFEARENGRYFNETITTGEPLETGGRSVAEPQAGGNSGPALNTGSEVYQPSPDAPDGERMAEMEEEFTKFRKKFDTMKAGFSLAGGLAGGAFQVLAAQKAEFVNMWRALTDGNPIKLDIDGDFVWHTVQGTKDSIAKLMDGASDMVYHLNSAQESVKAAIVGADIIPGLSEFGSHTLNTTIEEMYSSIVKQSWIEAAKTGVVIIGGLGTHFLWKKKLNIDPAQKNFEKERKDFVEKSEGLRERNIPKDREVSIEEVARSEGKPTPKEGQEWRIQIGEDENGAPVFEYRKIVGVDKREKRVVLEVEIDSPNETDILVDRISAEELLYGDNQCVVRRNNQSTTEPESTSEPDAPDSAGSVAPTPAPVVEPVVGADPEPDDSEPEPDNPELELTPNPTPNQDPDPEEDPASEAEVDSDPDQAEVPEQLSKQEIQAMVEQALEPGAVWVAAHKPLGDGEEKNEIPAQYINDEGNAFGDKKHLIANSKGNYNINNIDFLKGTVDIEIEKTRIVMRAKIKDVTKILKPVFVTKHNINQSEVKQVVDEYIAEKLKNIKETNRTQTHEVVDNKEIVRHISSKVGGMDKKPESSKRKGVDPNEAIEKHPEDVAIRSAKEAIDEARENAKEPEIRKTMNTLEYNREKTVSDAMANRKPGSDIGEFAGDEAFNAGANDTAGDFSNLRNTETSFDKGEDDAKSEINKSGKTSISVEQGGQQVEVKPGQAWKWFDEGAEVVGRISEIREHPDGDIEIIWDDGIDPQVFSREDWQKFFSQEGVEMDEGLSHG